MRFLNIPKRFNAYRFFRNNQGGVAIFFALTTMVVIVMIGGATEFSRSMSAQAKLQKAVDRAVLSTTQANLAGKSEEEAVEIGQSILNNALRAEGLLRPEVNVEFSRENGGLRANLSAEGYVKNNFLSLIGIDSTKIYANASAGLDLGMDLYVVLLIDATGSMGGTIEAVKDAAGSLGRDLRKSLEERGLTAKKLLLKVAYFGDLRPGHASRISEWEESPVYNLSNPDDERAFQNFVEKGYASGGGDTPESSLNSISYMLTEDKPESLNGQYLHTIVLWTDAPSVPLNQDVSVASYKGETQKCCVTFSAFESEWNNGGTAPLHNRRLGLYANNTDFPWLYMQEWENVFINPLTAYQTGSGIVEEIVNVVAGASSQIRLTN